MDKNNVFRDFLRYVSLNILGQMAYSCYTLADTFFVSSDLGANGLTALNIAFPVFCVINGTGLMIGMGGGTRYSILRSRGEDKKVNQAFTGAFYMTVCFAILYVLAGVIYAVIFWGAPQLAAVFNSEKNEVLQSFAVTGLRIYFLACPFIGFNIVTATYFISVERPRPAQLISLLRGFFILIPMAFLLSAAWKMTGVWCAYPLTEWIVALFGVVLYRVCCGANTSSNSTVKTLRKNNLCSTGHSK